MTVLTRGQIKPGVIGIDTTVKSATGPWRSFAPTWPMVMGWKRGELPWDQYAAQYRMILARVPGTVWNALAARPEARLLCYCRDGVPCHTHLIIEHAVATWPDRFRDGRTRLLSSDLPPEVDVLAWEPEAAADGGRYWPR